MAGTGTAGNDSEWRAGPARRGAGTVMTRTRILFVLCGGLVGTAILLSLGFWQVDRMSQKREIIAGIEARTLHAPVALPAAPASDSDRYRAVAAEGRFDGREVHVLSSRDGVGPGVRVIAAFETDAGRRVLVDRGFLSDAGRRARTASGSDEAVELIGNLDWPRDSDRFTPDPDLGRNLWFSREVAPIAAFLETEPVMIVLRSSTESAPDVLPVPLESFDIRDDHLEYALTWFSLAVIWAGMTAMLAWRMRRGDDQGTSG